MSIDGRAACLLLGEFFSPFCCHIACHHAGKGTSRTTLGLDRLQDNRQSGSPVLPELYSIYIYIYIRVKDVYPVMKAISDGD